MTLMIRADLHRLVDELPDASVDAAGRLLERAQDPMLAVLDAAPADDEPLTSEDIAAIEDGEAAYRRGESVPLGQVMAELDARDTATDAAG